MLGSNKCKNSDCCPSKKCQCQVVKKCACVKKCSCKKVYKKEVYTVPCSPCRPLTAISLGAGIVILTGTEFQEAKLVTIGDCPVPFKVINDSSITAFLPTLAPADRCHPLVVVVKTSCGTCFSGLYTPSGPIPKCEAIGYSDRFGLLGASTLTNASAFTTVSGSVGYQTLIGSTPLIAPGTGCLEAGTGIKTAGLASATASVTSIPALTQQVGAITNGLLDGLTLTPGLWVFTPDATLSAGSTLILDFTSDPNGVIVIQTPGDLTISPSSTIIVRGQDTSSAGCNVYWIAGGSATIANSMFYGNVIAGTNITVNPPPGGTTINGRLLSLGTLTLNSTSTSPLKINVPCCVCNPLGELLFQCKNRSCGPCVPPNLSPCQCSGGLNPRQ